MSTSISAAIRGITYKGEVTDMDVFFAIGYMMPNYSDVLEREKGLFDAFQSFSAEHSAMLAIAGEKDKQAVVDQMSQSWAERVILRLNTNLAMRSAFCQRMKEIFPDLPLTLINHRRWSDKEANIHEESSMRLDMKEVMDVLAPIVATMSENMPVAVAPTQVDPQAELANLRDQIAELRKGLAVSTPVES
jgi:hypothetical protein